MEPIEYTDVMVDIETTGLQPDAAAIIQIGAVPFRYDDLKIDVANMFKRSLSMPKTRYWSDGTDRFWLEQNKEVYFKIMADCLPWEQVMREFHAWSVARPGIRFWCKGLNFDWSFLSSYYLNMNMDMPYDFRQAKDLRSFISGLYGTSEYKEPEFDRVGDYHDALSDCLNQIKLLGIVKEETCSVTA